MVSDGPGRNGSRWCRIRREILAHHAQLRTPCYLCGKIIDYRLGNTSPRHSRAPTVHHIVGLAQGGHPDSPANMAPAHYGCNVKEGNRQQVLARRKVTASRQW